MTVSQMSLEEQDPEPRSCCSEAMTHSLDITGMFFFSSYDLAMVQTGLHCFP